MLTNAPTDPTTQDNTDDAAIDIYWRVAASYIRPTNSENPAEQKDAEDWTMTRDGAGYPASLLKPCVVPCLVCGHRAVIVNMGPFW